MATFKGLALALDRPLYGVPTAHAFAVAHPGRIVYAITDARRGEVFVDSAALEAPVSCKPAELGRWVPETGSPPLLLGNGAWAHRAALRAAVPHAELPEVEALHTPRVALLAVGFDRRAPAALAALEPLYVRRSDAELNYPDGFPTAMTPTQVGEARKVAVERVPLAAMLQRRRGVVCVGQQLA
jgi:tRNA A37 threonylcarbamoyladenosine modification protein TsaB